ncbi:MAG TPA: flavodoxin-dependent (E)-4-hydroxy-3-methylbut-2-enyl-diphosphate synthase [Candidatus Kapabacteria bacterium]|jgi:(E)-4-hydroxy-3-methylbut-2-enyl-diphosphate synthase|nr:flavodoxin-dependent (E)-4-hydroxy-3-methylbut-2-enyl-diphosphate synthase [Candidatus Kapabacteria bacterium]HOQ48311.1 flavodoxin-dependent (E)-4-hydroxy-3-methylbut-2-enyl-diphosphate synthase [Candidatus Kapabacteria bacterium]HPP40342.1 flavodoxin-dependent (E)-4-hydroxy-3-methylbut-2-enyl-diphosphate synthase [Candidatus Kapabacteria bacterium]HPU23834.1 flavodoxin-dependent (E)-4-hydroxy-3-methylbut-2-enyl-diphosphate synthase [Candidatus Kapabacteria bacterium]
MQFDKKITKKILVGKIEIGGGSPISIQTMTKTKTSDTIATLKQIEQVALAGADIVRVTVNDENAANSMQEICKTSPIPVVADIHFNYIFALKSIEAGVAKVRINPGNIGSSERIKKVLDAARTNGIPIRIGVNSGSLEKDILQKYGHPTAEALVESALRHVKIANDYNFDDICISVKSTSVKLTVEAYRLLSERTNYPLHLGVTEAGTFLSGTIKSAVGIGSLLAEGIGDTIRVSLTDDPVREVEVAQEILQSLELREKYIEIISCPTCGRLQVDLVPIAKQLQERVRPIKKKIKVALMGCAVNGPGEAREADIGVACGDGEALLFKSGQIIGKIPEEKILEILIEEIEKY